MRVYDRRDTKIADTVNDWEGVLAGNRFRAPKLAMSLRIPWLSAQRPFALSGAASIALGIATLIAMLAMPSTLVSSPDGAASVSTRTVASTAAWVRHTDVRGYSLELPIGWYELPSFGVPNERYFSNEAITAPLQMDRSGVWLTITIAPLGQADCIATIPRLASAPVSQSTISVAGQRSTMYILGHGGRITMPAIGASIPHSGKCLQFAMLAAQEASRDQAIPIATRALESIVFA